MSDYERALETCLEALREGRWTVDDCLRAFPQHADALRLVNGSHEIGSCEFFPFGREGRLRLCAAREEQGE